MTGQRQRISFAGGSDEARVSSPPSCLADEAAYGPRRDGKGRGREAPWLIAFLSRPRERGVAVVEQAAEVLLGVGHEMPVVWSICPSPTRSPTRGPRSSLSGYLTAF